MVMFFDAAAGIDAVGVAGERVSGVDLEAPDGEAVAVVVDDVEVGRVLQRDAVDGEVVRGVGHDDARNLLAASCAGLLGEIPPGDVLPRSFSPPRPSMMPSPMTPAPEMCFAEMSGLHPLP